MKAQRNFLLVAMVALSALPFAGCTDRTAQSSPFVTVASAEPAILPAPTNPPVAATVVPVPDTNVITGDVSGPLPVPEAAPGGELKVPPTLRTNGPALDIIKLAQAGVDDTVMLNIITNTTTPFNLTTDEIIYLNDLGVPGTVVTAIMQRDQELKQYWANSGTPPPAAPAAVPVAPDVQASAPTYVNAPQPVTQAAPVAVPDQQPVVVNNNYFNDTLSPYGNWVDIEGYGRCWQPAAVVGNPNWQPYGDRGRWVYSDAGWYWISDYSWGATTFHYGRWFRHARWGWCWWPDTVWAPSWVTFRYSGDYCGWAPLPPHCYYRSGLGFSYYGRSVGFGFDFGLGSSCFTFVSWNRFCDPHPWRYRADRTHITKIYNNTTIVNNYGSGNNNTVINRGISRDRVREYTRTEVKTVNIRDAGPAPSRPGQRNERLDRSGNTLVVHRPQAPGAAVQPGRSERPVGNVGGRDERPSHAATQGRPGGNPAVSPLAPVTTPRTETRPGRSSEQPVGIARPSNPINTPLTGNNGNAGSRPSEPVTTPATPSRTEPVARPTRPAPARPGTPPGGTTVIGRDANSPAGRPTAPVVATPTTPQTPTVNTPARPTETRGVTRNWTAPATPSAPQTAPRPSSGATYTAPVARPTAPVTSPSSPVVSPNISRPAPITRPTPTPEYSAPRVVAPSAPVRSYTPPAPSYTPPAPRPSAPVSAPAPSYTPRPAPAPEPAAPRSIPSESRASSSSGASGPVERSQGRPNR